MSPSEALIPKSAFLDCERMATENVTGFTDAAIRAMPCRSDRHSADRSYGIQTYEHPADKGAVIVVETWYGRMARRISVRRVA